MRTKWPTKKLGEICEVSSGGSAPQGSQFFKDGEYPFFRTADVGRVHISDNYCETKDRLNDRGIENLRLFEKGTILLPKSGASTFLNHRVIMGCDGYVVSHLATISAGNLVNNKFLYHFLRTVDSRDISPDTSYPTLKLSDLSKLEIPLPPLSIQKKIVARLDELLGKVREMIRLREEAIADTEKLLSTRLHEIFEEGKKQSWGESQLGEIANTQNGFACAKTNQVENGVVHLRTHNVDINGELNFDLLVNIPESKVSESGRWLQKGDLIFNNTNSKELVGKTAYVSDNYDYAFSNHMTRIRVKNNDNSKFLLYYLLHLFNKSFFEINCTKWIGQAGFNQTNLKKLKIPLPDLSTQEKNVKELDGLSEKINQIKSLQQSQLTDLKNLEQAFLLEAFNGEFI